MICGYIFQMLYDLFVYVYFISFVYNFSLLLYIMMLMLTGFRL